MPEWECIGAHRCCTDGDVLLWRAVEVFEEPHMVQLLERVNKLLGHFQYSLLLIDCTHAQNVSPGARRLYADWLQQNPCPRRVSLFFNASGEMQMFLLLARRGGELLSGHRSAVEIVPDEATAWRRIHEVRTEWAAP
jgi:hypothetical protein